MAPAYRASPATPVHGYASPQSDMPSVSHMHKLRDVLKAKNRDTRPAAPLKSPPPVDDAAVAASGGPFPASATSQAPPWPPPAASAVPPLSTAAVPGPSGKPAPGTAARPQASARSLTAVPDKGHGAGLDRDADAHVQARPTSIGTRARARLVGAVLG